MARRTKKVKSAGRFGPRYGLKVRRQISNVESQQKKNHVCPECNYESVKRKGTGIWECKHCGLVFAGGTYQPFTDSAKGRYISLENYLLRRGEKV